MLIRSFNDLPESMKNPAVRAYYDMLSCRRGTLFCKRVFDVVVSLALTLLLGPLMLAIAVLIKADSKGRVFYLQKRVTANMREFEIMKFRTMVADADKKGPLVTLSGDKRVTKIGRKLRKTRMDELPQLINVLIGDMSFVGTRPEVKRYVERYSDEMMATLLLPAGITSMASMVFKNEAGLLRREQDADRVYVDEILPGKMVYNLEYLRDYSFFEDIKILLKTTFKNFG